MRVCSSIGGIEIVKLERASFVIVLIVPPGAFCFSCSNNTNTVIIKKSEKKNTITYEDRRTRLNTIRKIPAALDSRFRGNDIGAMAQVFLW